MFKGFYPTLKRLGLSVLYTNATANVKEHQMLRINFHASY
jgi:hypothetical protein